MILSKKLQYTILAIIVVAFAVIIILNTGKKSGFLEADYKKFIEGYVVNDEQIKADESLQKRYSDRFEAAKAEILKDPNVINFWFDLSSVKNAVGDFKGAEEIYLYINKIRPENSISFSNLANLYTKDLPDFPKAEEMYNKALQNSKFDINTWRNFYEFYKYYYIEKTENRFKVLEDATRAVPDETSFWALLAQEYTAEGLNDNAIFAWKQFLSLDPDNLQAKEALEALQGQ